MDNTQIEILKAIQDLTSVVSSQDSCQQELLWAEIFKSTIQGSEWFSPAISLSPGRAAIGYNCLYPLYRILDDIHPHQILETGLGQSTKIISKYIDFYANKYPQESFSHYVVEHNKDWIDFFKKVHTLPTSTEIVNLDAVIDTFKNLTPDLPITNILHYQNFKKTFCNQKFDLIFIDGPNGSDGFSRIDILDILPDCLATSFVIMIDDYERAGEQKTADFIKMVLSNNGIPFYEGIYPGIKITGLIVSADLGFLCTL